MLPLSQESLSHCLETGSSQAGLSPQTPTRPQQDEVSGEQQDQAGEV